MNARWWYFGWSSFGSTTHEEGQGVSWTRTSFPFHQSCPEQEEELGPDWMLEPCQQEAAKMKQQQRQNYTILQQVLTVWSDKVQNQHLHCGGPLYCTNTSVCVCVFVCFFRKLAKASSFSVCCSDWHGRCGSGPLCAPCALNVQYCEHLLKNKTYIREKLPRIRNCSHKETCPSLDFEAHPLMQSRNSIGGTYTTAPRLHMVPHDVPLSQ